MAKTPPKDNRPRISSAEVIAYLEELARIGIYGTNPSAVATWIIRQEVMRLVEKRVIERIVLRNRPDVPPDEPEPGEGPD